jgi:hypothetical protein
MILDVNSILNRISPSLGLQLTGMGQPDSEIKKVNMQEDAHSPDGLELDLLNRAGLFSQPSFLNQRIATMVYCSKAEPLWGNNPLKKSRKITEMISGDARIFFL